MATKHKTTAVAAKNPYRWNASSWKTKEQWRKWEHVGMRSEMTLDDFVLDWRDWNDTPVDDLKIKGALENFSFERSIEQATTPVLTLRDPKMEIFSKSSGRSRARSDLDSPARYSNKLVQQKMLPIDEGWQVIHMTDIIERAVDLIVDGCHYRLVKVRYNSGTSQTELTFEDRIIYWLRRKQGPLRASRNSVTRAEFILRLLREVKAEKVPFICPQLHNKQRIAKAKDTGVSDDPDSENTGFSSRKSFKVQGGKATEEQRRNMGIVLDEASSCHGAKPKSIKAAVLAVIVESFVKNLVGGDRDSRGILQVRDSTAASIHINNRDIRQCVNHFMLHGFTGKGGAIELAKRNPHKSAGWVAQQVQGSAHPDRYDKWSTEANHWIDSWGAKDGIPGGGGTYVKSYQYTRDKGENSWEAMNRLAEEVNWRVFMVGKAMYYMAESDLFKRRIRHLLTPDSDEFIDLDCDIDWGKPVNEMTVRVNLSKWGAPPGCTIELNGFGPPDGRWLVVGSTRDWFNPVAELTLHQPGEAKREPAAERIQRSENARAGGGGGVSGGKIGKFYEAAKRISDHTQGYLRGGGHGPPLSQLNSSQKLDCSSSTSLALYRAGMWPAHITTALVSGQFNQWGKAGRGDQLTVWYNGGHVFSLFEAGAGVGKKRFDTGGPGGGSGPKLRDSWRSTQGFSPRHWPGT